MRHRRTYIRSFAAVSMILGLTAAAASGGAAGASIPKGPIKLGAVYTLNGSLAVEGQAELADDQAAISYVNAHGGIDGHKVELVYRNDQGDSATAVSAAESLVSSGVAVSLMMGAGGTNLANDAVFNKEKLPAIIPLSSTEFYNKKAYPYNFITIPSASVAARATGPLVKAAGVKSLGVLSDGTSTMSPGSSEIVASAKKLGIHVVGPLTYSPTATDDTTVLSQLKSAGVQAIDINGLSGFSSIASSLTTLNWSPTIFSNLSDTASQMGSLASKTYIACFSSIPKGSQLPSEIGAIYKKLQATGASQLSLAIAPLIVDGVFIARWGIEKANSLNHQAIASALDTMHNVSFTLPSVKYTYTKTADIGPSAVGLCPLSLTGPEGISESINPATLKG